MNHHEFCVRVYYEDTDAMGIVYYANYLRFFERARTEWLRAGGFDKSGSEVLGKKSAFVVRRCDVRFLKPAYHDDFLCIKSEIINDKKAQILRKKTGIIDMKQHLYRDDLLLVRLRVNLALMDEDGKASLLPQQLINYLAS